MNRFNLLLEERDSSGGLLSSENHVDLSVDQSDPNFVSNVLEHRSSLARVADAVPSSIPDATGSDIAFQDGSDGLEVTDAEIIGSSSSGTGVYALQGTRFNLLCLTSPPEGPDTTVSTWAEALSFCKQSGAMLIVDPPSSPGSGWGSVSSAVAGVSGFAQLRDANTALFYPPFATNDQMANGSHKLLPPSGSVAGVMARTDAARGVWKAPAGTEAQIRYVTGLTIPMSNSDSSHLNSVAINCVRDLPGGGPVVWGCKDFGWRQLKYLGIWVHSGEENGALHRTVDQRGPSMDLFSSQTENHCGLRSDRLLETS